MRQQQLPVKDSLPLCHLPYRKGKCTLKNSATKGIVMVTIRSARNTVQGCRAADSSSLRRGFYNTSMNS